MGAILSGWGGEGLISDDITAATRMVPMIAMGWF
jgi:hypothetical protein